jgi:hypothetical protein
VSDQQETGTGVTVDLERLFRSREFGHRRASRVPSAVGGSESTPTQLEKVFLSEVFGHPEAVAAAAPAVAAPAPAVSGRPALVLLPGGGDRDSEREHARHRGIAAVSGVAAAALAVAGFAPGTSQGPAGGPNVTEQAQGAPLGRGVSGLRGVSQPVPVVPAAAGTGAPAPAGASEAGRVVAQVTVVSAPPSAVVPQNPAGSEATATTPAAPGPPSGTPAPVTTPGSGAGSSTLTPAVQAIGTAVSSVGSAVTATSGELGQAVPVSSVTGALGTIATSALDDLGGGSPPTLLAGAMR